MSVVFILPTAGDRSYRGKYPFRPRSISRSPDTGTHIELLNGTRLWGFRVMGSPLFREATLKSDLSEVAERAIPMTEKQYAELHRAADLLRTRKDLNGHGARARVESEVRAICDSIQPTPAQLARRNAEHARRETLSDGRGFKADEPYRVFNRGPQYSVCFDFPTLGKAREYLAAQLARRDSVIVGAAPVGPDSNSIDPLATYIIWADGVETLADAPWHFGATDAAGRWLVTYSTPATVETRRENVEYHEGRAAAERGDPENGNPYTDDGRTDNRFRRWALGWREERQESLIYAHRKSQARDGRDVEEDAGVVETGGAETIDMTPTWAGILPGLIVALENGTATGQQIAREELAKMARLADERNQWATRLATAGPGGTAESIPAAINALWSVATAANEMWQALPDGDGKQEVRDTLAAAGFRVA